MEDRGLVYNTNKIKELILKAKGSDEERSIRQYAMDAGVSPANISRILKGDYKASPETLKKLTSERANPKCGVTFEELMVAAGYLDDLQENKSIFELNDIESFVSKMSEEELKNAIAEESNGNLELGHTHLVEYALKMAKKSLDDNPDGLTTEARSQIRMENERRMRQAQSQFELIGTGAVLQSFAKRGIQFSVMMPNETMARRYQPDMAVKVLGNVETEWWFEFKSYSEMPDNMIMHRNYRHILDRFIYMAANPNRKITIIVDMELIYEKLLELKDDISYKGDLSIAFLNKKTMMIEKEDYISHYYDDKKDEIKIV